MPNKTSKKSSAQIRNVRNFLPAFLNFTLIILAFICLIAPESRAQTAVGIKTDLAAYPEGTAPQLPRAGGKIIDPTFGTQIMRVTDEGDGKGFGTSYSYWSTFNANNTRLLVQSEAGAPFLYDFDPVQFRLTGKQEMIYPPGGGFTTTEDAIWSGNDPDTLFIHRGSAIFAFNARSRAYTLVADLSGQFPAGSYFFQMSLSRNDDVFAFTIRNADYSVGGYAVWQRSTNRLLFSERTPTLDEVQIDKTGRFLLVKTGQTGAGAIEAKVVDLQTSAVANLTDNQPDFAPGHSDNGRGGVIGADNWMNRLTYRNLATPREVRTVLSFGNNWDVNFHVSMLGDAEDWALVSFYGAMAGAFNGELVLVATDGTQRVRRFAHHHAEYKDYQDMPRANISRDGRYVAFTSNWGGSSRRDLFIAQVPMGAEMPAAPPPPTASLPQPAPVETLPEAPVVQTPVIRPPKVQKPAPVPTNIVFEGISGFATDGASLNKLNAPYYASAESVGTINGDGAFSYKYNRTNNGAGIVVMLDDGRNNLGVVNQGRYLEVRLNGVYLSDFLLDLNKTIKIERAGGIVRIWEDSTLRFTAPAGTLLGPAKFRIKCGGDGSAAGMGVNTAMLSLPSQAPVVTQVGYTPPPAAPVGFPAGNIFQNHSGFNPREGNALVKMPTPYYASAETVGIVGGEGWISYKYNRTNNGAGIAVMLDDGQHTFGLINQGRYLEVRLDGVYQADFLLDFNKTIKIEKAGGVLRVWEDATLRYSAPIGNLFAAAKFKVKCGGESTAAGMGINSVLFSAGGIGY